MVKNDIGLDCGLTNLIESAKICTLFSGARFVYATNVVISIIVVIFLWNDVPSKTLLIFVLSLFIITAVRFRSQLDFERLPKAWLPNTT